VPLTGIYMWHVATLFRLNLETAILIPIPGHKYGVNLTGQQ